MHPSASLTTSGRGGPPLPAPPSSPAPYHPSSLDRFNEAPAHTAETVLIGCCANRRWAARLAAHRPYPDPDALLAAADEASYDLSGSEVADALAHEEPSGPGAGVPPAAQTALLAAHDTYEGRFGHPFVICLDAYAPEEHLDQVLAGIRFRLGNEPDEERAVAADELRRLARGRLARLVRDSWTRPAPRPASPSVAV
ncbi:2-oxo-4-hydroxy-4-carboxy-5-ureidoimidazoline decarboxylase [Streptomyces sp. NPDC091272]|uniref:2-oxo-4-hydroxy-4-carboxy-5-ureidoimidazoline decarboxylase n=1 Tax=Streptomyces sp. NPDC091272 TaxID=3365981 RepID=UPI003806279F